ncbi:helix-hairpin-helix domain-containing protein, partial [Ruminococcus flavefaciens]|uniref:helix-hairpin-helix domain-containing protein n=1 Tax=Ruminococcus flavefaciens TaxID=1265 RepID=UPI0026EB1790
VSGVGPKAATAILSDVTPERFAFLVASGDSKAFTRTKGIGAKTAQRIVLELKDKISSEALSGSVSEDAVRIANIQGGGLRNRGDRGTSRARLLAG